MLDNKELWFVFYILVPTINVGVVQSLDLGHSKREDSEVFNNQMWTELLKELQKSYEIKNSGEPQVDVEFSIIDLARDIANYLIGSELTPTEKDVGTVSGHTSATGGDESNNEDTTYNSNNEDTNFKSTNEDTNFKSTNEDTNYNSNNEDTTDNSNNEDTTYKSNNEYTNYKDINEETNYKSTNVDTNYNSTNEDKNYNSINEETDYDSANEDTNYKTTNEDTNYKTTNEDTDYKSTNEETNYKSTNEDTDYKSANEDTNYETTNDDTNYNSNNEDTTYNSNNEDTTYKSNNEDANYETTNEDANYKSANEETNENTDNEYQFTGRFKSWEINDEVKPTWPIYHDKAYGNDRYIFDLKRPHDIRKEQRRHSHEKIDGRYDHGKNHGRYHHGRHHHHHGRHHHGRHHESKDHGQYKHDTGYGRYYHGEDYGGNHGEIDYGSLDEELIGEITEAADMPATSFAEIINRRLNNSPIPKFSAINYWKYDHAQNATLDEPREVVIEEVPTSASHLTSVIAPDFIDTPLKVPAIDLLLNLTSEESKGEILTNTAAQLITDTATDKETEVKSSQQEEYMDYPNLKLDSSVQDGSEDPTIVEHIPEIPELPKPDVTEANYDSMLLYAILLFGTLFLAIFSCILLANMCTGTEESNFDDFEFGISKNMQKRNTLASFIKQTKPPHADLGEFGRRNLLNSFR